MNEVLSLMASTFVSAITVLASVGGVLAVGFEFKAFVDGNGIGITVESKSPPRVVVG